MLLRKIYVILENGVVWDVYALCDDAANLSHQDTPESFDLLTQGELFRRALEQMGGALPETHGVRNLSTDVQRFLLRVKARRDQNTAPDVISLEADPEL